MFSFFRRRKPDAQPAPQTTEEARESAGSAPAAGPATGGEGQAPVAPGSPVDQGSAPAAAAPAGQQSGGPVPPATPEAGIDSLAQRPAAPAAGASNLAQQAAPGALPSVGSPASSSPAGAAWSPETNTQTAGSGSPVTAPDEGAAATPARKSWLARLKQGLARTGQSIGGLFVGVKVDEALFEELESALIMADAGVEATAKLLTALRARVKKDRLTDAMAVKAALRDILADHLKPLEKQFPLGTAQPLVVMIAGVNGAGKTTSIGKLAHAFQAQGASVLLAAGDTFRAAAREQLMEWGARNNVTVIAQEGGDPAAVAFDAVNAGRARQVSVVMVDTAGRLPTQLHLMEELRKIKRVIGKADAAAPHEVLLVVDGNTGQNAISQVKAFDAAIGLTGLVVTKLDGTAKGGTLAAIAAGSQGVRPIPVYWIGVGEGMHDLQPFVAREFANALLGD